MEHRHVGKSGLMVSEIAYGNWLTHGQQIDEDAAFACVGAALDAGITTFDTADMYADTRAEEVLGRALAQQRRAGLEISTKVYWPTGPGHNDRGLSRKHILDSIDGSLRRLRTDYVDIYWAHQYDVETPLEETMEAFHDIVRAGKVRYIGVSEWRAEDIRAAHRLARELRIPLIANQPQYSMLWRVIEAEVIPACAELGIGQIVWSPIAQGVLTGKYLPGQQPPSGSRGADAEGRQWLDPFMRDEVLSRVQRLRPLAESAGLDAGAARGGVDAAEPGRGLRDRGRVQPEATDGERRGGRCRARPGAAHADRRDSGSGRRTGSGPDRPRGPAPVRTVGTRGSGTHGAAQPTGAAFPADHNPKSTVRTEISARPTAGGDA